MKLNAPNILINCFYSEVTPESAEQGELSDCGEIFTNKPFTFSELVDFIYSNGFSKETKTSDWLSTGHFIQCYQTMTERQETLHFSRDNNEKLRKWFDLAVKFGENK